MKDYVATEADLNAIKEALSVVWDVKLDFIFNNRKLIQPTVVVSYDSKNIYLWQPDRELPPNYNLMKIPHNLSILPKHHRGWSAGVWEKVEEFLPASIRKASIFNVPRISGGLLKPFVALQKDKRLNANPYTTKESYLATIVHEFGHIYWQQHKLWWPSNKGENLQYLKTAAQLYQGQRKVPQTHLWFHYTGSVSELFASCTEYSASELFWPNHKKNFDIFAQDWIEKLIPDEKKKDLSKEDSVLESSKNPHFFATIYGKILLSSHPKTWPKFLLSRPKIF